MAKASISRAWDESRQVFAANSRVLTSVALALIIFPATVFGTVAPKAGGGMLAADGMATILFLVVMLVGLVARLTIARVALSSREALSTAMGLGARRSLAAIGAFLLFMIPIALLISPLIAPIVASPRQPPPGPVLSMMAIMLLALVFGTRLLSMVIPAAVAERLGSFGLLKRSWTLTRGNWLRLIGFVFMFYIGSAIASQAVIFVVGGVLLIVAGSADPMTISALLLALALAIVSALFVTIFSVMLARIYLQLASVDHAAASVPSSAS